MGDRSRRSQPARETTDGWRLRGRRQGRPRGRWMAAIHAGARHAKNPGSRLRSERRTWWFGTATSRLDEQAARSGGFNTGSAGPRSVSRPVCVAVRCASVESGGPPPSQRFSSSEPELAAHGLTPARGGDHERSVFPVVQLGREEELGRNYELDTALPHCREPGRRLSGGGHGRGDKPDADSGAGVDHGSGGLTTGGYCRNGPPLLGAEGPAGAAAAVNRPRKGRDLQGAAERCIRPAARRPGEDVVRGHA